MLGVSPSVFEFKSIQTGLQLGFCHLQPRSPDSHFLLGCCEARQQRDVTRSISGEEHCDPPPTSLGLPERQVTWLCLARACPPLLLAFPSWWWGLSSWLSLGSALRTALGTWFVAEVPPQMRGQSTTVAWPDTKSRNHWVSQCPECT